MPLSRHVQNRQHRKHRRHRTRAVVRAAASVAGAATLVTVGATLASAHVTVSPEETTAGSYELLTFSVPHGCEGSPTTEVAIDIPEEVKSVTPSVNPNWDVEVLDADGEPVEGGPVDRVVYTARTPLPGDLRDAFEISALMPEEPVDALAFPVLQDCEEGETAWDQIADEGEDPHELDAPAPVVEVIESADGQSHGGQSDDADVEGDAAADGEGPADDDAAALSDDDSGVTAVNAAALGLGILGTLLGGGALVYARRRAGIQS
ncbi:DUF1775 domain-containing protein [Actinobacteria bacterium YIM 96077]|uniref:Nuclear export factor GLE1 n=1 Tax=Phytoactinopolyspora halophila TaxID=1981511 RepID=A0A329QQ21_9ACTN|nr:YcnI family protein [Phytoactinopolyspora halophila]AYY14612.1 DUF1775 domain-containing protein [Actinobacteria bacterium YIM 96077]RAW14011.1 nuclear export factor GLE1 [Phytoactinopolyspora halophila]